MPAGARSGRAAPARSARARRRKLDAYRAKRDFARTAEPSGALGVARSARLRFVVQRHAARRLHYDLRLELDGVFKSWAVTRGPSLDPADKRLAVEVEDHPLEYGDFEGTIPRGEYGGGTVQLWDRGFWAPEPGEAPHQALERGELRFTLDGERLSGHWVLVRLRERGGDRRGARDAAPLAACFPAGADGDARRHCPRRRGRTGLGDQLDLSGDSQADGAVLSGERYAVQDRP
jgi:bifunctional non-homologous end joining protein LigD